MSRFPPLRFKHKLTLITMLASSVALLFAGIAFTAYEIIEFRATIRNELGRTAQILADNASAALSFRDAISAEQTLRSLAADPHIREAAIYDEHDEVFARYAASGNAEITAPSQPGRPGGEFLDGSLRLFHPIRLDGERVGTIYLVSDLARMDARLSRYAILAIVVLVMSSIVGPVLAQRLHRAIARPISNLCAVAGAVGTRKDYSVRAEKDTGGELGRLIDGFNEMLEQIQVRDAELQRAHEQLEERVEERTRQLQEEMAERKRSELALQAAHRDLMEASRRAGQAEVATSVLHNVGNVLNSVIVSATVAMDRTRALRVNHLALTADLLRQHQAELGPFFEQHPKGRLVLDYLSQLSRSLEKDRENVVTELSQVVGHIEHIKQIVTTQQSYAKSVGVFEKVPLRELIEQALALNADSLARHAVRVERAFGSVPVFPVDKHCVMQILVNLIRNAKEALKSGTPPGQRRLMIELGRAGEAMARVRVADNGIGIAPENLTHIFQHGFTTRRDGHGFGLHSGALAARQMGGRLCATSEGLGRGAAFVLEIPIQKGSS